MKRTQPAPRLVPALLLAALWLAAGCVRIEQTLTLQPDGSSKMLVRYEATESVVQRFQRLRAAQAELDQAIGPADAAAAPEVLLFSEAAIRKRWAEEAPAGAKLVSVRHTVVHARHKVAIEATFDTPAALVASPIFRDQRIALTRGANEQARVEVRVAAQPPENPPDLADPAVQHELRPFLGGFAYVLRVDCPAEVSQANTFRRSPTSATWSFEYDLSPESVLQLQRPLVLEFRDAARAYAPEDGPPT